MGIFHIKIRPYQKNSTSFRDVIKKEHLNELALLISNSENYNINAIDERNEGKYIVYEDNDTYHYICILYPNPNSSGRNSATQSLTTAYKYYYEDNNLNKKIHFYSLSQNYLNSFSDSIKNSLRLAVTTGINQLQPINDSYLAPYNSILDIIQDKNETRSRNKSNNPTFIDNSDDKIKVYGKVFGANAKDTELTLLAISKLTDKEINLFQVMDNNSKKLSNNFKDMAEQLNIIIDDKSYSFDDLSNKEVSEKTLNLRNKNFIYNLYDRFGKKKCLLCDCEIDSLIEGAHIFPIEAIKNSNLSDEKKLELAIDGKNGIWLCQNHHKLFDTHYITLNKNGFKLEGRIDKNDKNFIKRITMSPKKPKLISRLEETGLVYNTNYSDSNIGFNYDITDNSITKYIEYRNSFFSKNK